MNYTGIDYHKRYLVVCIIDATGGILHDDKAKGVRESWYKPRSRGDYFPYPIVTVYNDHPDYFLTDLTPAILYPAATV